MKISATRNLGRCAPKFLAPAEGWWPSATSQQGLFFCSLDQTFFFGGGLILFFYFLRSKIFFERILRPIISCRSDLIRGEGGRTEGEVGRREGILFCNGLIMYYFKCIISLFNAQRSRYYTLVVYGFKKHCYPHEIFP